MSLADQQAFEYLLEYHLDEVNDYCHKAHYKLEDLLPKPASNFSIKGVPEAATNVHHAHYEQLRSSKIAKLVSELSALLHSSGTLITSVNIAEPAARAQSTAQLRPAYSTPQEWMDAAASHVQMKRQKSLDVLQRLCEAKKAREEWAAAKLQQFYDKQTKSEERCKNAYAEHLEKVRRSQQHRSQVQSRKRALDQQYDQALRSSELKLKARFEQSRASLQSSKTPARSAKPKSRELSTDFLTTGSEAMLDLEQIEARVQLKEQNRAYNLDQRVLLSKGHSAHVQARLASVRAQDRIQNEYNLQQAVAKSTTIEQRTDACFRFHCSQAERTKAVRSRSFTRQSKHLAYLRGLQRDATKRLEQSRLRKEQSAQDLLAQREQSSHTRTEKNSMRKAQQVRLYSSVVAERQELKTQVTSKHHRLSRVADRLSEFKEQLASQQRETNFELQQLRKLLR